MDDFEQEHASYLNAWAGAGHFDSTPVEGYLADNHHGWFAQASDTHVPYSRSRQDRQASESIR